MLAGHTAQGYQATVGSGTSHYVSPAKKSHSAYYHHSQAYASQQSSRGYNDVAVFVPLGSVLPAVSAAAHLHVAAYFLDERSQLVRAMLEDATHNTDVVTVLTGSGERYAVDDNQTLSRDYPQLHVQLTVDPSHLKALFVDGQAYLGDRNFGRGTLLLRVPSELAAYVDEAIGGQLNQAGPLAFRKDLAQEQEVGTIDAAQHSILFESESFDASGPVFAALVRAVRRGVTLQLEATTNEAHVDALSTLAALAPNRVRYTLVSSSDKLVVADNTSGWVGSANETGELPAQRDWGYSSNDESFINTLRAQFDRNE